MENKKDKITKLTLNDGETYIFEKNKYSMIELPGFYAFLKNDFSSEFKFYKSSVAAVAEYTR